MYDAMTAHGEKEVSAAAAWPSAAAGALAVVCWGFVSVEKWRWSMFAALCAVHGDVGAVVRSRGGVSVSVRVQERVVAGLVRARCAVVRRVCLAGDRVVERGCRSGVMGQR